MKDNFDNIYVMTMTYNGIYYNICHMSHTIFIDSIRITMHNIFKFRINKIYYLMPLMKK